MLWRVFCLNIGALLLPSNCSWLCWCIPCLLAINANFSNSACKTDSSLRSDSSVQIHTLVFFEATTRAWSELWSATDNLCVYSKMCCNVTAVIMKWPLLQDLLLWCLHPRPYAQRLSQSVFSLTRFPISSLTRALCSNCSWNSKSLFGEVEGHRYIGHGVHNINDNSYLWRMNNTEMDDVGTSMHILCSGDDSTDPGLNTTNMPTHDDAPS